MIVDAQGGTVFSCVLQGLCTCVRDGPLLSCGFCRCACIVSVVVGIALFSFDTTRVCTKESLISWYSQITFDTMYLFSHIVSCWLKWSVEHGTAKFHWFLLNTVFTVFTTFVSFPLSSFSSFLSSHSLFFSKSAVFSRPCMWCWWPNQLWSLSQTPSPGHGVLHSSHPFYSFLHSGKRFAWILSVFGHGPSGAKILSVSFDQRNIHHSVVCFMQVTFGVRFTCTWRIMDYARRSWISLAGTLAHLFTRFWDMFFVLMAGVMCFCVQGKLVAMEMFPLIALTLILGEVWVFGCTTIFTIYHLLYALFLISTTIFMLWLHLFFLGLDR